MAHKNLQQLVVLVTALTLSFSLVSTAFAEGSGATLPDFDDFAAAVENGQAGVLRGVYVPDTLALRIVQQPSGDAGYVSPVAGVATQFSLADAAGNVGLLAHNYLAGAAFPDLAAGQSVSLIYGDGNVERFTVSAIYRYQAVDPNSTSSDFIDLATGKTISAAQLFNEMYTGSRHVTFQTCISKDDDLSWGRLFVVAEPAGQ